MRTPKIEALHRLINWYNNRYNTKISIIGLDETPLQSNSWLSGMLVAKHPKQHAFVDKYGA